MKGFLGMVRRGPARVRLARLERLQGLTEALSAAFTPEDVGAIIFDRGLGLVGARAVTLFWETSPGELELVHGLGLSDAFVQRFRRIGAEEALPSAEAYRTGVPVWLGSPAEIVGRYPALGPLVREENDRAWAALPLTLDRARGALGLRFDSERRFDEEERAFVLAVARQCAQALERARLYDAQRRLAARVATLQSATSELSAAATRAEVAAIVFRRLVAVGAREAAILELTDTGDALALSFAHGVSDAERARLARVPLGADAPEAEAARAGVPLWRAGPGGRATLPLRAESHAIGVLTFPLPESAGEDLRSDLLALAQQGAQALDRARLFEGQKRLAERLARVHSTAAALSGAATPLDVAQAAFGAVEALGASGAEIHAVEGTDRIALLARHGTTSSDEDAAVSFDAQIPPAEVIRTGKAVWLPSRDELEARFPRWAADPERRAAGAWACVPLLASGNTLGAFTVAFPEERALDPEERSFVRLVAQPCAQALERARLFEAAARSRREGERRTALLEAAFAAAPAAVALLDREGRYVRVNAAYASLSGASPEAHAGKTPSEIWPSLSLAAHADAVRGVIEGRKALEVILAGEPRDVAGGARRRVETWFPVRVGGQVVGIGVIVRGEFAGLA
jgi:PAS domain S-box-containing protein